MRARAVIAAFGGNGGGVLERALAVSLASACAAASDPLAELASDDVVWTTPSADASGSMPIGNGSLGANVWVEPNGDLVLLVSHTDAWSETARLLKLGRVRVRLEPPLDVERFEQRLRLECGRIEIRSGKRDALEVFVDVEAAAIRVAGAFAKPHAVRASFETWRNEPKVLRGPELDSSWAMHGAPPSVEVREGADRMVDDLDHAVALVHRNETSIVPFTLRHQGLGELVDSTPDPLLHREMRLWIGGDSFEHASATGIVSLASASVDLAIGGECVQRDDPALADGEIRSAIATTSRLDDARTRTENWWRALWKRSYVFVGGGETLAAPANDHPLRIGADSNGENRLAGRLRRASVLARALAPDEVAKLAEGNASAPLRDVPGLVASWAFGSQMLDWFLDGSSNGIDLKIRGAVEPDLEQGSYVEGARLEAADDPRFDLASGFTLEAWLRLAPDAGPGRIFDKLTAGRSDGWLLDTHPGRALRVIAGGETLSAPDVLSPGAWTHVAATCDARSGDIALFVDGKLVASRRVAPATSRVTQAYVLQRWVTACAARGSFPIKFNGSIFTVEPRFVDANLPFDADWRRWGGDYWWQNTRLPYHGMLARGEADFMRPLWKLYRDALPLCERRAKLYHDVAGAYFPETMTVFGTYSNGDYGWDRAGIDRSVVLCPWWQWAWNQGPELVALMLDRFEWTRDAAWARAELLPTARVVLRWFDARFGRDEHGILVLSPTQSLETYWDDVVDDMPTVAGLRSITSRLLAHAPALEASGADVELWTRVRDACPPLPKRTDGGTKLLDAAERHGAKRSNVENPELYSVFPFGLHGVGSDELAIARETYRRRVDRSQVGWTQDGIVAARLGLAGEAAQDVVARAGNSSRSFRFPAMWGPNFDWLPDQDHGANLMTALQEMLMQCHGDAIELLPAWPKSWSASFRLHAPRNTVVEGVVEEGKLASLTVTPASRRPDVRIHDAQ